MLFACLFSSCSHNEEKKEEKKMALPDNDSLKKRQKPKENPYAKAKIDIKTFKTDSTGWGYDIYIYDGLYVHQPCKPGISGNMGFRTEELARKTGEFVAYKIRNNIMPPSVTPQELDSLGVLK